MPQDFNIQMLETNVLVLPVLIKFPQSLSHAQTSAKPSQNDHLTDLPVKYLLAKGLRAIPQASEWDTELSFVRKDIPEGHMYSFKNHWLQFRKSVVNNTEYNN